MADAAKKLKGVEMTCDAVPGGFEVAFYEEGADQSFAAVALNPDDARALVEMLVRGEAVNLSEVRP